MLKKNGYEEYLEKLDYPIGLELAKDLILDSLPISYNHFVINCNFYGMDKNLSELH